VIAVSFTTDASPTDAVPSTVTGPCGYTVLSAGLSIVTEMAVPPGNCPSTATAVLAKSVIAANAEIPDRARVLRVIPSHPHCRQAPAPLHRDNGNPVAPTIR
jgi:hypothetical protein